MMVDVASADSKKVSVTEAVQNLKDELQEKLQKAWCSSVCGYRPIIKEILPKIDDVLENFSALKQQIKEMLEYSESREKAHRKAHSFAQMWRHIGRQQAFRDALALLDSPLPNDVVVIKRKPLEDWLKAEQKLPTEEQSIAENVLKKILGIEP